MDPNDSSPMLLISDSIISGGTFTQNNDNRQTIQFQGIQISSFDRFREEIAPSAFHNSSARLDPPRCYENTRVDVIRKITDWISREDAHGPGSQIMWLHGAAGAGKSAITQSIAERCSASRQLLASFFFGGFNLSRNQARFLFPTIAYQIALASPTARQKLTETVEHDPLIFSKSLSAQFQSLIVDPLCVEPPDIASLTSSSLPRLIIIDALDECSERRAQAAILDAIFHGIRGRHLPALRFLISSRPEHEILVKFNSSNAAQSSLLTKLALDETYFPERDIEFYLRARFKEITETHPFRRHVPEHWPPSDNIKFLARKSSGQFIYASTVVKYVESSRHRPHHRLEVILNIRPTQGDQPFSELDTLYRHIFSSATEISQVLLIISFYLLENFIGPIEDVEDLLDLERGDIEIFFCDLSSIISTSRDESKSPFRFLHESLHDFLLDKSRSGPFHIDMGSTCADIIHKCFLFLTYKSFTDTSLVKAHHLAMKIIIRHGPIEVLSTSEFQNDCTSFSLSRIYDELKDNRSEETQVLVPEFNIKFLPWFFGTLLEDEPIKCVESAHLSAFENTLKEQLEAYYANPYLIYLISCIGYTATCHDHDWILHPFLCFRELGTPVQSDVDARRLTIISAASPDYCSEAKDYLKLLGKFLSLDIAETYALDGVKYATAAVLVLYHLCDNHRALQAVMEYYFPTIPQLRVLGPLGAVDQVAFFLNQADRSDPLVYICHQGKFGTLARMSYSHFKKLWGATEKYLKRVDPAGV